jgi:hypothetical protein
LQLTVPRNLPIPVPRNLSIRRSFEAMARRTAAVILWIATSQICAVAIAQAQVSGAESHVLFAAGITAAGGAGASPNYQLDGSLSAGAELAAAPQWSSFPATVWSGSAFQPTGPLLFFVLPSEADRNGGMAATVVGHGFAQVGAGTPSIALGGQAVGPAFVASNSLALITIPVGTNVHGNPLGLGSVVAQNAFGSALAESAFTYTPAVVADGPVRIGCPAPLRVSVPPASFYAIAVGGSIPGFALPLPPLQGSLELIDPILLVSGVKFSVTGQALFQPPVADNMSLIGVVFELQALSLTSLAPLAGTFSNRLVISIQP